MKIVSRAIAVAFASFALATAAQAATITYDITGTGSGSLNGTAFTNASFDIELVADTGDVSSTLADPLVSATVKITGFSDAVIVEASRLGFNTGNNAVFFSRGSGNDFFDFFLSAADGAALDLTQAFGPLVGQGVFALTQFQNVATSAGALSFDSSSDVLFSGGGGGAGGVPEPSTWALMLVGFGGLGVAVRCRRAASATLAYGISA